VDLTQSRLQELFSYNPDTGALTRKINAARAKAGDVAGCLDKSTGYLKVNVDGKLYLAHRIVWMYAHGSFPSGVIDHINMVKSDNKIENLRDVTYSANNRNMGLKANNTSGMCGVSWNKGANLWEAYIGGGVKNRKRLGYAKHLFDAACLRKSWEVANPIGG